MPSPTVFLPFLLSGCMAQVPLLRGPRQLSDGVCKKDTGATCNILDCWLSRGPTECTGHFLGKTCKCLPGFCVDETTGNCVLDTWRDIKSTSLADASTLTGDVHRVDKENPTFPGPAVSTALAFSGGGSRSLTMVMGQLRALLSLGVMQNVDAISSVSGGSWASSVYMFAKTDEKSLLGTLTSPPSLSMDALRQTPPAMGNTIVRENLLKLVVGNKAAGCDWDKVYQLSINDLILKPFGLDSQQAFMAASQADKEEIIKNNPKLKDHQFLIPREGRPKVFLMNGILLNPIGEGGPENNGHPVSFQMSPDYSGSPFYPKIPIVGKIPIPFDPKKIPEGIIDYKFTKHLTVGGGLVQTFAVGNAAPAQQSGGVGIRMPSPRLPFTLGDAIGISSSAYAEKLMSLPSGIKLWNLIPEVDYWPVTKPGLPSQAAVRFEAGDAGLMDNTGMLPMLQRGAKKIVWFVNEVDALVDQNVFDFCTLPPDTEISHDLVKGKIGTDVHNKFVSGRDFYNLNVVFSADVLGPYLCELQKLKTAGKPTVLRKTFVVNPNSWWGIQGKYEVDTLLVYNDKCRDFENQLPQDTKAELAKGSQGDFKNYPHYATLFPNSRLNPVGLTSRQVNLLAAQAEYAVIQNREIFEDFLR